MLNINKKIFILAILFCLVNVVFVNASLEKSKLVKISEAYGSSPGSDKWSPNADLNHDNIIDIHDLALASKNEKMQKTSKTSQYDVMQSSSTLISVEPRRTVASVGSTKKNFTINISIADAPNTWAWQFRLSWDPSKLNITNTTEATFLSQNGEVYCSNDTDYDEGWILVGCTLLEPASPANGNGVLASINFTILSLIDDTFHLSDTYLLDYDLIPYTHTTRNGFFAYTPNLFTSTSSNGTLTTRSSRVITKNTSGDWIVIRNGSYTTAWESDTGFNQFSSFGTIGQGVYQSGPRHPTHYPTFSTTWQINRAFLFFNTSFIPEDAMIESAILKLFIHYSLPHKTYDIVIQKGEEPYPHDPLQETDFNKIHYSGNYGSINTNDLVVENYIGAYNNITITDSSFISNGITKLVLCSSDDIAGQEPPKGYYYQLVLYGNKWAGREPKLYVTYTSSNFY